MIHDLQRTWIYTPSHATAELISYYLQNITCAGTASLLLAATTAMLDDTCAVQAHDQAGQAHDLLVVRS